MSGFAPSSVGMTALDPNKRVNYRLGLVLGEDEFRQDQFHLRERDHYATRALHGYGTVSGLGVHYDDASGRLHVRPGLAVDPAGRLICVPVEYCGSLVQWLADKAAADEVSGGLPPSLSVYVLLCWTECETDEVPIPAGSCMSAEDSRAASRLKDSFELKLSMERPPVVGETAQTSLGDSLADLVDQIHGLLDVSGGSPPDTAGVAALLRGWAVDRRPEVEAGTACLPAPDQTCVPLARVDVELVDGPSGIGVGAAVVDDRDRPILVSTRLLQEALFAVGADEEVPPHRHALAELEDVDLTVPPAADDALVFDGVHWVAGTAGVRDHGSLTGLTHDDHPQYLLVDGGRALGGNLSAGGHRLSDLPPSIADGQPLVQGQGAFGDLRNAYPDPTVARIQGIPVSAQAPAERDALVFHGGNWEPRLPWVLPFATIQPLTKEGEYMVWFNLDAPANQVEVEPDAVRDALDVQEETDNPDFLNPVIVSSVNRLRRNVFLVKVEADNTPLRFTFDLNELRLTTRDPGSVLQWAKNQGIWFVGQGGDRERERVTIFTIRSDRLG
jgi:hypothetical protein